MKTQEELSALKAEVEALNRKLAALSEDELAQVSGGFIPIPYFGSDLREPGGMAFPATLKEKAILPATDTASASDRRSHRTELEQLTEPPNDNAL